MLNNKPQEINKIYEFVKRNFALLSFGSFAFLAILDFYIFTETFHMSGAIYYNRLLTNTLSSFGQFGLFIAIPILFIIFLLTFLYISQFLLLDTSVKITRICMAKKRIKNTSNKILFLFVVSAFFGDSFFLWLFSQFSIHQLSISLFLIYISLIGNNIFSIAGMTYYLKIKKDDKFLEIKFLAILFSYMMIKIFLSIFLSSINLAYIGVFITFNALFFVFLFSWHVLYSNKFNVLRIKKNTNKKNNYLHKTGVIIGFAIILYFFIAVFFHGLYTDPFQNSNFWKNYEKNKSSFPWQSASNIFNPAKMERKDNLNFSLIQKEEINDKYQKIYKKNNEFFDGNLIYYSIPYGEKALIFIYDNNNTKVMSVYAHIDDLTSEVKKIYDIGYIDIK